MRILICGDRNWTNVELMRDILNKFLWQQYESKGISHFEIIEGEARGADSIAKEIAIEWGLTVHSFPANWNIYGKAAGPVRNLQMIQEGQPDYVIAFHNDIAHSKGTKNMLSLARKHNIPYEVIKE